MHISPRPQFHSTLRDDADIDHAAIAVAARAIMNGLRAIDAAIYRLERQPVTAADVLLNRVVPGIDFAALERAQDGVQKLETLLGPDGTVVMECADNSVASLREQVDGMATALAPYQALRRKSK